MPEHQIVFSIFLIFAGAAVLSTFALLTHQSMLVAYMVVGILLGPSGLKIVADPQIIRHVGDIGILFLLFLLGLHLPPQKLGHMLKKVSWVGLVSSLLFFAIGYLVGFLFSFSKGECLITGAAMMFSSTIIGIKLLPTTILHHQHTGEMMISVLLLQDLLAIFVLLLMRGLSATGNVYTDLGMVAIALPALLVLAFLVERFLLKKLLAKFNRIKEYLFLLSIAWCLSLAQLSVFFGLSAEIGAFIAGVSLAASPISFYIAESLKPVRDFFLVMFFFSIGAIFDLHYLSNIIIPSIILTAVLMLVKPWTYRLLLQQVGENKSVAWEIGVRLAQCSEFSLIIAYVGIDYHLMGEVAANCLEAVTILTFVISSYWVVMRYPSPLAFSEQLRRD
jgi:Kef-type K+ transport system membrane component KefB